MTASVPFVFFRYPTNEAYMIEEDSSGNDSFLFVDFENRHPFIVKGNKIKYSKSWDYVSISEGNEIPYISSREDYMEHFSSYQRAFLEKGVSKAILSRVIEYNLDSVDYHKIFQDLCDSYPNAMVYLANLGEYGIWAGATPERLLKYEDGIAKTVALAGTKKSSDPDEWGIKEREEHKAVEDYIVKITEDERFHLLSKSPVYLKKAGQVYHQKSDFEISINQSNISLFLEKLHPTPAVCGSPLESSKALIRDIEQHKRLFYTGYLGLLPSDSSEENSFEYYVNLRCMQIIGKSAYLYLGGGITSGSDSESEWQETIDKSKTLMAVL
ncbi:chorismate-binding protein [Saprospiraceae bacterium]|nr:chorismate-binding protein [Saprospiraceae bacterium]